MSSFCLESRNLIRLGLVSLSRRVLIIDFVLWLAMRVLRFMRIDIILVLSLLRGQLMFFISRVTA